MKLYKTILTLISITVTIYSISSCERDDICSEDTPTTPLLIIKFIDNVTRQDIKQPIDLEVRSTDSTISDSLPNVVSRDSIMIPLKTNSLTTEFKFIINTTDSEAKNEDIVSFNYTPKQEYVSSACGFKVTYREMTRTLTPENNNENWIKDIKIQKDNVTDETSAHIYIYH